MQDLCFCWRAAWPSSKKDSNGHQEVRMFSERTYGQRNAFFLAVLVRLREMTPLGLRNGLPPDATLDATNAAATAGAPAL